AAKLFDDLVARQDTEFELDVAALRRAKALTGDGPEAPPSAHRDLRELVVEARARTLVAELELFEERGRAEQTRQLLERERRRVELQERQKRKLKARLKVSREPEI